MMILSTTPTIEGHTIKEYKGVVTGETIIGANFVKDFFAGIRDIVGGRSSAYEKVLREAAEKERLTLGFVEPQPIQRLYDFHCTQAAS